MAAVPQVGDYIRLWLHLESVDITLSISRSYRITLVNGTDPLAVAAANLVVYIGAGVNFLMGTKTYKRNCDLDLIQASAVVDTRTTSQTNQSRTTATGPLPPSVCGLASFYGLDAPPRSVSRVYFPWLQSAFNDANGRVTATGISNITAVANSWTSPLSFSGGLGNINIMPVVLSKDNLNHWDIVSVKAHPYFGTQRRRNRGNQKKSWNG